MPHLWQLRQDMRRVLERARAERAHALECVIEFVLW